MQVVKVSTAQTKIKGSLTDDRVLILCDTTLGVFTFYVPLGGGSVTREIIIKNIGINNLFVSFDMNSQLCVSSGKISVKTLAPDECLPIMNDKTTGKWYQINNSVATYST
jgi:hypothetical protein